MSELIRQLQAGLSSPTDALISDCQKYRYFLSRRFPYQREDRKLLPIVMLNPSTADASLDDPTIRRCKDFAYGYGYNGIFVINLYAFRATNPKELWLEEDPVGPLNREVWAWVARNFSTVLCAWGNNAKPEHVKELVSVFTQARCELVCLGVTKLGQPKHPLYLSAATPIVSFDFKGE